MKLKKEYYDAISEGKKTIEGRVYDAKTTEYKVGDTLSVTCDQDITKGLKLKITGICTYADFWELVSAKESHDSNGDSLLIPGKNDEAALAVYEVELNIYGFVARAKEEATARNGKGVIGIHVKLL
jgi:ASC-1-like (ASCH) protein